ncbi:metal-dependent hydrolase [Chloroflexia bacterium SDU3-3]|nr:metal-dependent hydrolase [Chloroflexia bacterium SDU3-3]
MSAIGRDTTLTWLGHATWHILSPGGKRLLIDAWLGSSPTFPASWAARLHDEGVDYILITHGHMDHIGDLLGIAEQTKATLVCQFDIVPWLVANGVPEERIIGFNKGGAVDLGGVQATMTNATHSSTVHHQGQIIPMGTEAGYVLRMENGFTIYHTGDTAVHADMQIIGALYQPELTILPIGDHFTMGPRQAAYALKLIGSRYALPSHYGTFPLLRGTPDQLRQHLAEFAVQCDVLAPKPGEPVS